MCEERLFMPDIAMRFAQDMLVISAPFDSALERQGVVVKRDLDLLALFEPETLSDALRLELVAGAQCMVAPTRQMTPARLAHDGMRDNVSDLIAAALSIVTNLSPQHVLVEFEPCGLPFDGYDATSLKEHRDQYLRVAQVCEATANFDAYFLSGFSDAAELKCALMGIRQVSDRPILASLVIDDNGEPVHGRDTLEDAIAMMQEYGANVLGVRTGANLDTVCSCVCRIATACDLPICVELLVSISDVRRSVSPCHAYGHPDTMIDAARRLRAAGAQFLRAVGAATPVYTGALVAAVGGLDVLTSRREDDSRAGLPSPLMNVL